MTISESLKLYTAPAVEPITLQEAKAHLKLESGTFAETMELAQSIGPDSHAIAAAYSLKGSGVDVSAAANIMFVLNAGTCGVGGSIDVKLQHSNTDVDGDYVDVTGGAFAQVTEANDNQAFELAYTGTRQYVRAVATVAVAACAFGVSALLNSPANEDDDKVTKLIVAARRSCEIFQRRAYITQTWNWYMDEVPAGRIIEVPKPPLQSVSSIKYKDAADGTLQTISSADYIVDINREPGRIALAYDAEWPDVYQEIQAFQIQFVCGYGLASAVPDNIKEAILKKLAQLYENRGDGSAISAASAVDSDIVNLLRQDKIYSL